MKLNFAIRVLAELYQTVDKEQACAIRKVVATAIANDELGIGSDDELKERAVWLLNQHLGLYPLKDRNYKKRLRDQRHEFCSSGRKGDQE